MRIEQLRLTILAVFVVLAGVLLVACGNTVYDPKLPPCKNNLTQPPGVATTACAP
jgi:hypothetical protein